jgi:polysaccharide biosynthesis protein PelD
VAGSDARGSDSRGSDSRSVGWGEVLALTLLVPLGIVCVAPNDPLLLGATFPWLALLPLLLGAQHGALAGALSTALLVSVGVLHAELRGGALPPSLAAFGGGCLAIGVLAGFFRDRVQARLSSREQQSAESARKLAALGRVHAVLELSHRRLEERLAARGWSIASAFRDARRALAGGASLSTVGDVVLGVLSKHAFVQSATLVGATLGKGGRYELRASTCLNGPAQNGPAHVDLEHRLVQRAIETGRLVVLDAENADLDAGESIVAVAPLRSVSGRLLGLVLVHEMPFMAFQAENLENLAALTALLADLLEERFLDAVAEGDLARAAAAPGEGAVASGDEASREGLAAIGSARDQRQGAEDVPRSGVHARRGRGFVGNRSGTHRRRRFAQSA